MALESIRDHVFTAATDMWSFGVLLWEIMTHALTPYPQLTPQEVLRTLNDGKRLEQPRDCPIEVL